MRYTGPVHRLQRAHGMHLGLKSTNKGKPLDQKPGAHTRRFGKQSEYAKQLQEKQKAKRIFGITEKQCRRYYKEAVRRKGVTGKNFLNLLEMRLDNIVYRAGFALTRAQARQMVNHGVFEVNGKKSDIASIQLRPGDVITAREKHQDHSVLTQMEGEKSFPPKWLDSQLKKRTITVSRFPEADEMEQTIATHMIVEFYSR